MKFISAVILTSLSITAFADTTLSLPALQTQANNIQQAIMQQQQASTAAISDLQNQLSKLQTQLAQYASPDFQKFTWATSDGANLPQNAFVAVRNGNTPLYVCQATYNSGNNNYGATGVIEPGMVTDGGCIITYGGQAYLAPTYSVLVSTSTGAWVDGQRIMTQPRNYLPPVILLKANTASASNTASANPAPVPSTNQPTPLLNQLAVVGGQENGQDVYICRSKIGSQYFIGKVSNNACYIAAGSKEASWPVYEVLLVRQPS